MGNDTLQRVGTDNMDVAFEDKLSPLASSEKYQERLSICENCENLKPFYMCEACGCMMLIKAKLEGSKCIIDKW